MFRLRFMGTVDALMVLPFGKDFPGTPITHKSVGPTFQSIPCFPLWGLFGGSISTEEKHSISGGSGVLRIRHYNGWAIRLLGFAILRVSEK